MKEQDLNGRKDEEKRRESSAARAIIFDARKRILMQERFLDSALFSLDLAAVPPEVTEDYALDGQTFQYNPEYVISSYQKDENAVSRAFFHTLLHLLFLHPFASRTDDPALWNLSCDIAAEGIILSQHKSCFSLERDREEREIIDRLQDQAGMLTAERIYQHLLQHPWTKEKRREVSMLFRRDSHDSWYVNRTLRELLRNRDNTRNDYGKLDAGNSDGSEGKGNPLKTGAFSIMQPDDSRDSSASGMQHASAGGTISSASGPRYGSSDLPYPLLYLE
ncbi:MAG: hypothetical protein ACI4W2_09980, partial [Eubacterium sp.]